MLVVVDLFNGGKNGKRIGKRSNIVVISVKKINDSYINSIYNNWFRFDLLFSLKKMTN